MDLRDSKKSWYQRFPSEDQEDKENISLKITVASGNLEGEYH